MLDKAAVTKESIFWRLTGTGGPSTGFVEADPKLADPAHGNFAPTAGSPAIAGADASEIPDFWIVATDDFLQKPLRVAETGRVTIGAVQNAYVPKIIYVDAAKTDDSGDGLSPATAKKTLAGVAALAICGDTIEAAPGDYDDGTMAQTEAVIRGNYSKVVSRAILPSGVSLVSRDGAESTRIVGSTNVNAWVRGLVMADVILVDGGVRLSDGSTLSLDWASRGLDPLIGYRIQLDLNGTGVLTVRNGDQIVATLTASGQHVLDLSGADPLHLTFAFAGADATATLSRFSRDRGFVLFCR